MFSDSGIQSLATKRLSCIKLLAFFFSVFYSLIHVCSVSVMNGIFYIRIILILLVRTWWFKLSGICYFNNQNTKLKTFYELYLFSQARSSKLFFVAYSQIMTNILTTKFDFEIGNFIAVLYFLHRK